MCTDDRTRPTSLEGLYINVVINDAVTFQVMTDLLLVVFTSYLVFFNTKFQSVSFLH